MKQKRVLLDENLSPKLRKILSFPGNDVVTTRYQGWDGKRNGELIALAETGGFDVFITRDRNLSYQQNMRSRKVAVVVVIVQSNAPQTASDRSQRRTQEQIILHNAQLILAAIHAAKVNDYIEVLVS